MPRCSYTLPAWRKRKFRSIRKYGDEDLLKCKGTFELGVDYKRVKGKKTDKLCITVYVKDASNYIEIGVGESS